MVWEFMLANTALISSIKDTIFIEKVKALILKKSNLKISLFSRNLIIG